MATKKPVTAKKPAAESAEEQVSLKLPKREIRRFRIWIVGNTPLITHAWSEKARREMLEKQQKETKEGKDIRNPEDDFRSSLYEISDGKYGFPVTGIKKAILSSAHKDKGAPRTVVRGALYINSEVVRVRPAYGGAICDMPLVRIYGGGPDMREDMVRVGAGMKKTANLGYRAQFWPWAINLSGRINTSACPLPWLPFLIRDSGMATGIGDWRSEKDGVFGAFHLATPQEEKAWDAFVAGRGLLPKPSIEFEDDDDEVAEAAE